MTPERWLLPLLCAAAALSILRLAIAHLRAPREARPAAWRTCVLAVLTMVSAGLLARTLQPPPVPVARDTLVVLTAGWQGLPVPGTPRVVALPEAGDGPLGALRMPDLATALRRHPDVQALAIVGAGLTARDRDAVGDRALAFVPAALPDGIVALETLRDVAPGARFEVRGRVAGREGAQAALFDPAGRIVDTSALDEAGGFRLAGTARGVGAALFSVRVRDADDAELSRVEVPVIVEETSPVRVLLLAGAPNPDLRALRRWAEDTGLRLRWRVALGGGTGVGDAPALDAAGLAEQDLVLLEARAFDGLSAGTRAALRSAVANGLGVLVHAPQPPSRALREWLRGTGLAIEAGPVRTWRPDPGPSEAARLRAWAGPGSVDAPFDPLLAGEAPPALTYRPLAGGLPASAASPQDMMRWQAWGRGRIGLVTLADSWRLPLAGRADLHAALWSSWAGTLARAGDRDTATVEGAAWVGERVALCGLGPDAQAIAPDGRAIPLLRDPAARDCAGLWPRVAGWYRIVDADRRWPLQVRASEDAPALSAAQQRARTQALVRERSGGRASQAAAPGSSWPWALAWLLATTALWALGRARLGRAGVLASPQPR
ncbi:carboxypeptidase regulatory-like domain-containing protein [Luteimonas sp. S4-F44]|uniref:carboxypeptidase regulatory-like domain-containing protein n=1 Tax=Luteimonas sp. S4-F44 TaxID=2925842 RepID=UPI001F5335A2|nr:carboxypeptidase regulatory-like domain-containing protein [Luteimonas sp. S4-F44]UNK41561.1 carboxypeptidase regulatory-like domain-containing protein [Luteimonas sp. S4-F44]